MRVVEDQFEKTDINNKITYSSKIISFENLNMYIIFQFDSLCFFQIIHCRKNYIPFLFNFG